MFSNTFPCAVVCLWAVLRELCAADEDLRPHCPVEQQARCKEGEYSAQGLYMFKVDDHTVSINFKAGTRFEMKCDTKTRSAEHPALPRFPEVVRVRSVRLEACAPPAEPYALVLNALNVYFTDELVLDDLPDEPPLRNDHFEGLSTLKNLTLEGKISSGQLLPPALITPLKNLAILDLKHVRMQSTLEFLHTPLLSLQLHVTGIKTIANMGLNLARLSVSEDEAVSVNVTGASALSSLDIASTNSSVVGYTRHSQLQHLGIDYWSERQPEPWLDCGKLEQFKILYSASKHQQTVLPDGWVARCPVLSELSILQVPLAPLPERLLQNATALKSLTLKRCSLEELPKYLFNDSVQLISLDLSENYLKTLPNELFSNLRTLEKLKLSENHLIVSAMIALKPLSSVIELTLSNNVNLSDLCDADGPSFLEPMKNLTKLMLKKTNITRICKDWREKMPQLLLIDLLQTNITVFKYEDVIQRRSVPGAKMKVSNINQIVELKYTSEDYKRAQTEVDGNYIVSVYIRAKVVCDCNAYWAARSFRDGPRHMKLPAPFCSEGGLRLHNVLLDKLVCPAPELCTKLRGCSCVLRGDLAIAKCQDAGLTRVPGPLPQGHSWQLILANNSITSVSVTDLPENLHELDLYNNTIEELDKDAVMILRTRKVRLDNNPFRCHCDALGLLELVTRPQNINLKNVTCGVKSKLLSLDQMATVCSAPSTLEPAILAAALMVVFVVLVFVLVTVLFNPGTRLRIKILLHRVGLLPRPPEEVGPKQPDDGRLFDAFVSYAHEDEEWVRSTLVKRLEGEPAPFRLCVHYRDWAPGEWIPAQIAASVRNSRRTLAVVSRHFLNSEWARLEFREAHAQARRDVTPRLVVLLLEEPAQLPLDAEMRAFIENNTYVRWGDPWFWKKLEHAMPPRPRVADAERLDTERSRVSTPTLAPAESSQVERPRMLYPKVPQSYCTAALHTPVPPPSTQHVMILAR